MKGYDSHLIIREAYTIIDTIREYKYDDFTAKYFGVSLGEIPREDFDDFLEKVKISAIPVNNEKFLSFNIGDLRFIDSFQFMSSSLEKLTENLYDRNDKYKNFQFVQKEIPEHSELLCQKGFYPYDWMDDNEKFKHQGLPPREAFYSRLKQETITQEEYEYALYVYEKLRCQSFLDYHLIYLKSDVLLLADIFENFRTTCMNNYKLDPANYISAPGLAWDAMLLETGIELDLITDLEMLKMIENSKRGGLCFVVSKRMDKANNKYLEDYNPNDDSTYIMYWDANNLYGWAMSQYLPFKNLRFRTDITLADILSTVILMRAIL